MTLLRSSSVCTTVISILVLWYLPWGRSFQNFWSTLKLKTFCALSPSSRRPHRQIFSMICLPLWELRRKKNYLVHQDFVHDESPRDLKELIDDPRRAWCARTDDETGSLTLELHCIRHLFMRRRLRPYVRLAGCYTTWHMVTIQRGTLQLWWRESVLLIKSKPWRYSNETNSFLEGGVSNHFGGRVHQEVLSSDA